MTSQRLQTLPIGARQRFEAFQSGHLLYRRVNSMMTRWFHGARVFPPVADELRSPSRAAADRIDSASVS